MKIRTLGAGLVVGTMALAGCGDLDSSSNPDTGVEYNSGPSAVDAEAASLAWDAMTTEERRTMCIGLPTFSKAEAIGMINKGSEDWDLAEAVYNEILEQCG